MNVAAGVVLAVGGVVLAYILHELTHMALAHLVGGHVANVGISRGVLTVQIDYPDDDPPPGVALRAVAIGPLALGIGIAAVVVASGLWEWLAGIEPYYAEYVAALLWLVYAHPSPSDVRSALRLP